MPNQHSTPPDYESVHVPEGKKPPEYSYTQRRAEILDLVRRAGHPTALNQAELAKRYDVDRSNICRDFKRLREYAVDIMDPDRADWVAQTAFRTAIRELQKDGKWEESARVLDRWLEWLYDRGKVGKEPEKRELDADVDVETREAKVYANLDVADLPGVDKSNLVGLATADDTDAGEGDARAPTRGAETGDGDATSETAIPLDDDVDDDLINE